MFEQVHCTSVDVLKIVGKSAKSVEPDLKPHFVASDLSLHCLLHGIFAPTLWVIMESILLFGVSQYTQKLM